MTLLNKILQLIGSHVCTDSGTSSIWRYKKYADGSFEATAQGVVTGSFEGVYFSANLYVAYDVAQLPFTAMSITYANGHAYTGTGSGWLAGLNVTTTSISVLEAAGNQGGSGYSTFPIHYNLEVEGTWK